MVLFLFVVMLLAIDKQPDPAAASGLGRKALVACAAVVLLAAFARVASRLDAAPAVEGGVPAEIEDSIEWLAKDLMENHLLAFELSSMILIAAMAGVMVYTTRRRAAQRTEGA
jgi:NADH-quinone oxidoreductase subunit J